MLSLDYESFRMKGVFFLALFYLRNLHSFVQKCSERRGLFLLVFYEILKLVFQSADVVTESFRLFF